METKYKVVRFYFKGREHQVCMRNLTKDQAIKWCNDPETSSSTATSENAIAYTKINGDWFDGWTVDD